MFHCCRKRKATGQLPEQAAKRPNTHAHNAPARSAPAPTPTSPLCSKKWTVYFDPSGIATMACMDLVRLAKHETLDEKRLFDACTVATAMAPSGEPFEEDVSDLIACLLATDAGLQVQSSNLLLEWLRDVASTVTYDEHYAKAAFEGVHTDVHWHNTAHGALDVIVDWVMRFGPYVPANVLMLRSMLASRSEWELETHSNPTTFDKALGHIDRFVLALDGGIARLAVDEKVVSGLVQILLFMSAYLCEDESPFCYPGYVTCHYLPFRLALSLIFAHRPNEVGNLRQRCRNWTAKLADLNESSVLTQHLLHCARERQFSKKLSENELRHSGLSRILISLVCEYL